MELYERFVRYVTVESQSDDTNPQAPSSAGQVTLGKKIVDDLKALRLKNIRRSRFGVVYATLPANTAAKGPVIGLIAHMDTALETSGKDVKPRLVKNYQGAPILLNETRHIVLSPDQFPSLKQNIGEDLVVTDGTTLLGADDKAGVAIIFGVIEHLLAHPEIPHGKIRIAFTPDEEIGRGTENFDVRGFNADFAYTLDGGDIHEISYENFNAASAKVSIRGVTIHPGYAKGKMVNAALVAMAYNRLLPAHAIPAETDGHEGFNHLVGMQGEVGHAELRYILRNHDAQKLEAQKRSLVKAAAQINARYGADTVQVEIKDGYRNMLPLIKKDPVSVDRALAAYAKLGIAVEAHAIRGGTDGANLSFMGLLTPNLPTGGYNAHGPFEYASLTQMHQMVDLVTEIVRIA